MNLIISDNLKLLEECFLILKKKKLEENFHFASTMQLKSTIINKVTSFNVKDDEVIDFLIINYRTILSVHCKMLFPEKLVKEIKCFNLHPGYNPINRGWFPQVFAITEDLQIGATLHEIDVELGHGDIIDRRLVNKEISDTSQTLYNRILEKELDIFTDNIESLIALDYIKIVPENEGNIFYKSDFNKLCEIDLQEQGTFLSFYNKLRALTFNGYNNAYFKDPIDNKKVFINLKIEKEE
jgi:methionyl-tRNA formyltransferase